MLAENKKAPAFSLPSTDGGKLSLKDFAGKTLILYFYPRDNTPGCTTEAQEFRDALPELQKLGAEVVGVSKDTIDTHCGFRDKHSLTFPLLTDADGRVMEKYGAWGEKNNYGKVTVGVIRTTVIIGADGKVQKIFPRVRVKGHVDRVVQTVRDLQ